MIITIHTWQIVNECYGRKRSAKKNLFGPVSNLFFTIKHWVVGKLMVVDNEDDDDDDDDKSNVRYSYLVFSRTFFFQFNFSMY